VGRGRGYVRLEQKNMMGLVEFDEFAAFFEKCYAIG